jgi:cob(I)alamin adenosyltransferase
MGIYTKTGDDGTTGIYKGCKVNKDTPVMEAIGTVDELNSVLGLAISFKSGNAKVTLVTESLYRVQKDLFVIGAVLAGNTQNLELRTKNLEKRARYFENQIDIIWGKLPVLKNFILPSGTNLAATLFFTRAVCRRAERRIVSLKKFPQLTKYLNRLSDYLFVLARYANYLEEKEEIVWTGYHSH